MFSGKELTKLGEQISQDYLQNGTPLTEGLEKVASQKGLNGNQIDRVAEAANVKTHLSMLKTAEEDYIEFDIAKPNKVKPEDSVKVADVESYGDYEKSPSSTKVDDRDPLELAGVKLAEEGKPSDATQQYNDIVEKRAYLSRIQNYLQEADIRLDTMSTPMYSLCKQACLGGTPKEDLQYVIKEASPNIGSYIISDILEPRLEKDGIDFSEVEDLEKKASARKVNPENELFKAARNFSDEAFIASQVKEIYDEKLAELGDSPMEKSARGLLSFTGNAIKGTGKWLWDNPLPATAMAGVGSGIAIGVNKERAKHLPLNQTDQQRLKKRLQKRNYLRTSGRQ